MMIRGRLFALFLMGTISAAGLSSVAHAAEAKLPGDLQSLKTDLVTLNKEITLLENELMFPSAESVVVKLSRTLS